jgi:hypothetical protein
MQPKPAEAEAGNGQKQHHSWQLQLHALCAHPLAHVVKDLQLQPPLQLLIRQLVPAGKQTNITQASNDSTLGHLLLHPQTTVTGKERFCCIRL